MGKKNHTYEYVNELEGFIFKAPSRRKGKKYDVFDGNTEKYIASFGSKNHQQFFDRIGYYSNKDHKDINRLSSYYKRHGLEFTPRSPKFFSHFYLWAL